MNLTQDLNFQTRSKGALQFSIDKALPKTLVKKLIAVRLREIVQR